VKEKSGEFINTSPAGSQALAVEDQEESHMNHGSLNRTPWSIAFLAAVLAGTSIGLPPRAYGAGPCAANPENRALDFWLGEWTISAPGGSPNATSRVTLELDKCVVFERWNGGSGHTGENLFAYSADDKSWHGMFADNEGRVHVFLDGTAAPGSAEFSGPSRGPQGETILNRVTIHRVGDGRVEQVWQKSSNDGKTWTTVFRGEYTRKQL
jgi:hypothetical protein